MKFYDHELTTIKKLDEMPAVAHKTVEHTEVGHVHQAVNDIINEEVWSVNENDVSKVVDENGEPKVMYHGTPYGGFETFKDESYFTGDKEYADIYHNPSASSNRSKHDPATNAMTYEVFLNIRKPFDTRNPEVQEIFDSEFYRKWGNGAPLADSGLPDWTDATDLLEFIDENEYDFDGIILDEGGTGGYGDEVKSRGLSYVPVKPEQIKSATGNNGNFDVNDANIYHQRAAFMSREQKLQDVEREFDKLISEWHAGKIISGQMYDVMDTPLAILNLGIPFDKIKVFGDFFHHSQDRHSGMSDDVLRKIPRAISDPIMIVSGSKPDSYVFVLEIKNDDGSTVVVPLEIEKRGRGGIILGDIFNSAFGKDNSAPVNATPKVNWFTKRIAGRDVLYINKEKSTEWADEAFRNVNISPVESQKLKSALSSFIVSPDIAKVKTEQDLNLLRDTWTTLYQKSTEENTLVGVHNLSEANLRHALKMGGLANPSMAIVDTAKQGLEGFGEITLIGIIPARAGRTMKL